MNQPSANTTGQHATYQICLKGHLDLRWREQLDVPELTHQSDGTTMLRGVEMDQAALHGLLLRIRDLGLTLISLVCIAPATSPDQPDGRPQTNQSRTSK